MLLIKIVYLKYRTAHMVRMQRQPMTVHTLDRQTALACRRTINFTSVVAVATCTDNEEARYGYIIQPRDSRKIHIETDRGGRSKAAIVSERRIIYPYGYRIWVRHDPVSIQLILHLDLLCSDKSGRYYAYLPSLPSSSSSSSFTFWQPLITQSLK